MGPGMATMSPTQPVIASHAMRIDRESAPWVPVWMSSLLVPTAAALCILAALPILSSAAKLWLTDPLRSMGMFIPVVSAVLIVRAWHDLGWRQDATWWGIVALLTAVGLTRFREAQWIEFSAGGISFYLPPDGGILAIYASALILVVGGPRLLRACVFPVCLLLMTNPVPDAFTRFLDLPLQHLSAEMARRFAFAVGEHPDGEQLRLMFTPNFGMFIAPGCNGIRGAIVLAYVGLIASYWRGFSRSFCVLAAGCGLALGYLFNLLRLCSLVFYYKIGRSVPSIQPHGAMIDYAIGAVLFLLASSCFAIFLLRRPAVAALAVAHDRRRAPSSKPVLCLAAIALFVAVPNLRAFTRDALSAMRHQGGHAGAQVPQQVGQYKLVNQWAESDQGVETYRWGRYSDGDPSEDILLGLWMQDGYHNALNCHTARAEQIEHGEAIVHRSADGSHMTYSTFSYDDGNSNYFNAATLCEHCTETGVVRHGPLLVIPGRDEHYFDPLTVTAMLIKHETRRGVSPASAGYEPVRAFISGLDEDRIMSQSR